jgi:hypothetical protein
MREKVCLCNGDERAMVLELTWSK